MPNWTANNIPDQSGRVFVVTGANTGLGYETTLALAKKGAHIVMACRSMDKATTARDEILAEVPGASLEIMHIDLADLDSVAAFTDEYENTHDRLDVLVNNAGVMAIPQRETAQGFEMQMGVNHYGHFALTGHLVDIMLRTPSSRIVTVSSGVHRFGPLDFDNLNAQKNYARYQAYAYSKLANLLFAFELQRKLTEAGMASPISVAAHPGYSATELQVRAADSVGAVLERAFYTVTLPIMAQSAARGALPQLYAATAGDVLGCDFIGPRVLTAWGAPTKERASSAAYNEASAARLWRLSVEKTGVDFAALRQPA